MADRLRRAPIPDRLRAEAWDAFEQATDADDLARRLDKIAIGNDVKADLWDLKAGNAVAQPKAEPRAPALATLGEVAASHPSATRRFAGGVGEMLNPITMVKGLAQAVAHPIDTVTGIVGAQVDQGKKAYDAAREGRYSEAVGHAGAAILPVIGPAAAHVGEEIAATGDVATGVGRGVGLAAQMGIPAAVRGTRRALTPNPATLEAMAAERITDVMTPRVGPNKVRLGNQAAKVAPKLAKELAADGAPMSKGAFHADIQAKLAEAIDQLDAASDARLGARAFKAQPLLDALKAKRNQLQARAVDASDITTREAAGQSVTPRPNAQRAAQLDRAIKEIESLGPDVTYDAIKTIRQAYDGPARARYAPSVTADYLKVQGAADGAADVTAVLRDHLAKWDPETAAANAQYSLYKSADDVLKAAAEVERARPKLFRQVMTRLTGAMIGGSSASIPGALAGYAGAAALDAAMASGMTTQLKYAGLLQKLANGIRKGDMGTVNAATAQLKRLAPVAASETGRATSPSESRRPLAPSLGARP